MKLQYNEIITALAKAMDWSANAMWVNGYDNPEMKEMAIANIDRALENIGEAVKGLHNLRAEISNNK